LSTNNIPKKLLRFLKILFTRQHTHKQIENPTKNPQKTHKKPTKNPQKTHKKPTKNPQKTHKKPTKTHQKKAFVLLLFCLIF